MSCEVRIGAAMFQPMHLRPHHLHPGDERRHGEATARDSAKPVEDICDSLYRDPAPGVSVK